MCFVVYAVNKHSKYQLVVAANRDEKLDRPTQPATKHHFGDDTKEECISGVDNKMQGTWIGINRSGKIAALTNYYEPAPAHKGGKPRRSRGALTRDCLQSGRSIEEDLEEVAKVKDEICPFNLLLMQTGKGTVRHGYVTNRSVSSTYHKMLSDDVGGISNGYVDDNEEVAESCVWSKILFAKSHLSRNLREDMEDDVLRTLEGALSHEVHPLKSPEDFEYSARIPPIVMPKDSDPSPVEEANKENIDSIYATRLITFILVDYQGNIQFKEKDIYKLRGSDIVRSDTQRDVVF